MDWKARRAKAAAIQLDQIAPPGLDRYLWDSWVVDGQGEVLGTHTYLFDDRDDAIEELTRIWGPLPVLELGLETSP